MTENDDNTINEPASDNLPVPIEHSTTESDPQVAALLDELRTDPRWQAYWQMTTEEREQHHRDQISKMARAGRSVAPFYFDSLTDSEIDRGIRRTVNKLKEIRTSRGMTISQVAGFMGVDKSVVSKFENGLADPRLSTLLRYAQAVRAAVLVHPVSELDTSVLDGISARLQLRAFGQPDPGPQTS